MDLFSKGRTPEQVKWLYFKLIFPFRYPVRVEDVTPEEPGSVVEHIKDMQEEMKKAKPRDTFLLSLMRNTFHDRRIFIKNDAVNVADEVKYYPALGRPTVVNMDFFITIDVRAIKFLTRLSRR